MNVRIPTHLWAMVTIWKIDRVSRIHLFDPFGPESSVLEVVRFAC